MKKKFIISVILLIICFLLLVGAIILGPAFFKAAKKDDLKSHVNLNYNDSRLQKFYHGEEIKIDGDLKGFTAVLVEGVSTGFGKASAGTLKNRYPKGLRSVK